MVSQEGGIGRGNRVCYRFVVVSFPWQCRGSPDLSGIGG